MSSGNAIWDAASSAGVTRLWMRLFFALEAKSIKAVSISLLTCALTVPCVLAQAGSQPAQAPGSGVMTLKANVRRVSVDVVVTDSKGHPVKGLGREDFQVFEDGVPQQLRSFDAHAITPAPVSALADRIQLPPNTFVNLVRAPEDSPVTVILYDVLNTPAASMPYAHDAMVKFIKGQKGGSRIAIFVLGDSLRMLQGFTDDETRLIQAVNSKSARTQQSTLLLTDTSDGPDAPDTNPGDLTSVAPSEIANLKSLETTEAMMMQQQRLEETVSAFEQIARFLSTLPGRKNVIWMSGSFPTAVLPNGDAAAAGTQNEFGDTYSLAADIKLMNDLLNAYHISIYPVDVRGLQVDPVYSASGRKPPPVNAGAAFSASQAAEHASMDEIADSTGGQAFYNTNGLAQAMQSAQEQGSTYYTLSYAPTNPKYDGTLRKISLKLKASGYQMAYRRSYFADDPDHPAIHPGQVAPAAAPAPGPERSIFLDAGMKHGAPISSELFFESIVNPVGGPGPASPKEMEQLSQFMAEAKGKKLTDPEPVKVQHYRVDYVVLGRALEMPEASEGKYRTDMMFAVAAFTPDSLLVNGVEVTVKNVIPTAQYQKIRTQGYHANLEFVVPVAATSMRIAARDDIGSHMGSIEIPLPVLPAPEAAK
jgi:VWFA-related protein